jgi:hypothetical protein
MTTVDFMKGGTSHLSNGQLPVKRQPGGGVSTCKDLASRSRSANSISPSRLPSVACAHHATILQSPSINAGLPSAAAWSHPTAERVPSTAEFAKQQVIQRTDIRFGMDVCKSTCKPFSSVGGFLPHHGQILGHFSIGENRKWNRTSQIGYKLG